MYETVYVHLYLQTEAYLSLELLKGKLLGCRKVFNWLKG
jgi:hypothetical protein